MKYFPIHVGTQMIDLFKFYPIIKFFIDLDISNQKV